MRKSRKLKYSLSILYLIGFFSASPTWASNLPAHTPVPGGIAVLSIPPASAENPKIYFRGQRVLVTRSNGHWHAIVGLPLSLKLGSHYIESVAIDNKRERYYFKIETKHYPAQYITVKKKKWVTPNKKQLERIFTEREIIIKALTVWNDVPSPALLFRKPVDGRISSLFGLRRFFNKKSRRPHSGLDIAAPIGTTIRSPADGTILLTGNYYFNGKTVFIDHGQNMISMLNHLSKITVKSGDKVKQGDKIGEVGKTGRVTGPHLHWSLSLNNARVDPLIFMQQSNNRKNLNKTGLSH